jgi:hypothetical protein
LSKKRRIVRNKVWEKRRKSEENSSKKREEDSMKRNIASKTVE